MSRGAQDPVGILRCGLRHRLNADAEHGSVGRPRILVDAPRSQTPTQVPVAWPGLSNTERLRSAPKIEIIRSHLSARWSPPRRAAGSFCPRHPRSLTAVGGAGAGRFRRDRVRPAPDQTRPTCRSVLVTETVTPAGVADTTRSTRGAQPGAVPQRRHARQRHRRQPAAPARRGRRGRSGVPAQRPDGAHACSKAVAGKMVRVLARSSGQLDELVARFAPADPALAATHFTRLRVQRVDGPAPGRDRDCRRSTPSCAWAAARSASSLFAATDDADIPDAVASQMAEVFATEIDFHRELRKGDTFSVVYETLTADGEPITWNNARRPGAGGRVRQQRPEPLGRVVQGPKPARAPTSASTGRASSAPSWPARWSSRA